MKKLFYIYCVKKACKEPLLVVDSKEAADKVISKFSAASSVSSIMSADAVIYNDGDLDEIPWDVGFKDGKVNTVCADGLLSYGRALNEKGLNYYGGRGSVCVMAKDAEEAISRAKELLGEKGGQTANPTRADVDRGMTDKRGQAANPTRADVIRGMTDEELSDFLTDLVVDLGCTGVIGFSEWLKQSAEECRYMRRLIHSATEEE